MKSRKDSRSKGESKKMKERMRNDKTEKMRIKGKGQERNGEKKKGENKMYRLNKGVAEKKLGKERENV